MELNVLKINIFTAFEYNCSCVGWWYIFYNWRIRKYQGRKVLEGVSFYNLTLIVVSQIVDAKKEKLNTL